MHSHTREDSPACSMRVSCTCSVRPFPAVRGASSHWLLAMLELLVLQSPPSRLGVRGEVVVLLLPRPLLLMLLLLAFWMPDRRWLQSAASMLTSRGSGSCMTSMNFSLEHEPQGGSRGHKVPCKASLSSNQHFTFHIV